MTTADRSPRPPDAAPSTASDTAPAGPPDRIAAIEIERGGIVRYQERIEAERRTAVEDLLAGNRFCLARRAEVPGPYRVRLSRREDRLIFDIRSAAERSCRRAGQRHVGHRISLNLTPLRRTIRDYFTICDAYFEADNFARPGRLEAIDAGRKALHDEGAQKLRDQLAGKIELDQETARRLFTLICVMHIKG